MPQPEILTTAWSGFQLGAEFGQDLRQAEKPAILFKEEPNFGIVGKWRFVYLNRAVCVFEPIKPRGGRGNNPAPT
jgi:hypothetical protein